MNQKNKTKKEAERLEKWNNSKDIEELLKLIKGGTILEIGCGTGRIIEDLSKSLEKSKFEGIDINSYFIEIAKQKNIKNADFVCTDINDYDIKKEKYDFVIFRDSLHEIREKGSNEVISIALEKVHSCLKKGGILLIRDAIVPKNKIIEIQFNTKKINDIFNIFIENSGRKIKFEKTNESIKIGSVEFLFFLSQIRKIELDPNREVIEESKHYTLNEYKEILLKNNFHLVDIKMYRYPLQFYQSIKLKKGDLPESYVMLIYKK